MIIRIFRANIRKSRVSEFKQMVQDQSIPWLESSDGMLGCFPGEPFGENAQEFVMITLWRDLDALEAFAGTDWEFIQYFSADPAERNDYELPDQW